MKPVRCFIGLPLPEEYQDRLKGVVSRLAGEMGPGISWTRPGNWHLTLKFLGDVPESETPGLSAALSSIEFQSFDFQAAGCGFFPDARRPRVVWIGLARGAEESAALAASMDQSLKPLGFEPENRPFRAHLTLGRVRKPGKRDWSLAEEMLNTEQWPLFRAGEFVLWQSILGPNGPRYVELARVKSQTGGRGAP